MKKQTYLRLPLVFTTIVVVAFNFGYEPVLGRFSYAQEIDQVKETLFGEIRESFDRASAEEIPIFSPKNFARARKFYQEALKKYERGERLEDIRKDLEQARTHLEAAFESARVVKVALEDLIALRAEALELAAKEHARKSFFSAEGDFQKAVLQAEEGDIRKAKRIAPKAEVSYRDAILVSVEEGLIRESRMKLEEGKALIAPEKYEESALDLQKAEELLEQSQKKGIVAKEFLDLVEKMKVKTIGGTLYPDLTIELYGYEVPTVPQCKGIYPWPPLTDRPTILEVLIKNVGKASADGSFNTKLYVDDKLDTTYTFPSEDEKLDLGPQVKILLEPGGSRIYDYEIKFPKGGKHKFRWVVDANKKIEESDESEKSNVLDTTVVWQAPPDLIVEDIWPVGTPGGGQKSTWKIKVTNNGTGDVNIPFLTTFWPEVAGGSQENFWTQSLAANKSVILTTTQNFRSWGKGTLKATVDVNNYVPEALPNGEKNNERVKQFDLAPVDLVVENLTVIPEKPSNWTVTPKNPLAYEGATFPFTVKNIGTGNATQPFKVRVMPGKLAKSIPPHDKTSEYLLQPDFLTVKELKAGDSVTLKHKVKLPAGDYQVIIEADPDAVYFEPNRNNNVLPNQVKVIGRIRVWSATVNFKWVNVIALTKWPVNTATKVTLTSSNPNVLKVVDGEFVIPIGDTDAKFALEGVAPGVTYLGLSAKNYQQASEGYVFLPDNRYKFTVHGKIKLSPASKTIEQGKSFNLTASIDPVPSDRKVKIEHGGFLEGPDGKANSHVITIPYGKKSTEVYLKSYSVFPINQPEKVKILAYREKQEPMYVVGESIVTIMPKGKPTPTPPSKNEVIVWLEKNPPLNPGKIAYVGSIYPPVPNGVLQTIENVNTGLGNQWGVRIVKSGYSTNDCDKAKSVIDLAPGKSTDYFKGASLSKGYTIVACIYPVSVSSQKAPNKVAVKVTFTK